MAIRNIKNLEELADSVLTKSEWMVKQVKLAQNRGNYSHLYSVISSAKRDFTEYEKAIDKLSREGVDDMLRESSESLFANKLVKLAKDIVGTSFGRDFDRIQKKLKTVGFKVQREDGKWGRKEGLGWDKDTEFYDIFGDLSVIEDELTFLCYVTEKGRPSKVKKVVKVDKGKSLFRFAEKYLLDIEKELREKFGDSAIKPKVTSFNKIPSKKVKGITWSPNSSEQVVYEIRGNLLEKDNKENREVVLEYIKKHHKSLMPTNGYEYGDYGMWSKRELVFDFPFWYLTHSSGYSGG
jgi:hypothetical protein